MPNTPTAPGAPTLCTLRPPTPNDGRQLWDLATQVGLDVNSPYAYVLWGEHFADTSVVAMEDDRLVGFVIGFRLPAAPDEVFVWQIGVVPDHRGRGTGSQLLDDLVDRTGAACVEATVTPSNAASAALFRALAKRNGTTALEEPGFAADLFPAGHEAEVRFRIPLPRS